MTLRPVFLMALLLLVALPSSIHARRERHLVRGLADRLLKTGREKKIKSGKKMAKVSAKSPKATSKSSKSAMTKMGMKTAGQDLIYTTDDAPPKDNDDEVR